MVDITLNKVHKRIVVNDDSALATIIACIIEQDPYEVKVTVESGLVFMGTLLDMLLRVRASIHVHLDGLLYTSHAENADTYRLLKERPFREEGPTHFSRKLVCL